MPGAIQHEIIRIGMKKGYVDLEDVKRFYTKNIKQEMNKLVIRGHFHEPEEYGVRVVWRSRDKLQTTL